MIRQASSQCGTPWYEVVDWVLDTLEMIGAACAGEGDDAQMIATETMTKIPARACRVRDVLPIGQCLP